MKYYSGNFKEIENNKEKIVLSVIKTWEARGITICQSKYCVHMQTLQLQTTKLPTIVYHHYIVFYLVFFLTITRQRFRSAFHHLPCKFLIW